MVVGIVAMMLTGCHTSRQAGGKGWWGNIRHKENAWVTRVSRPNEISRGLEGRHLSLWASHGRYFDNKKKRWAWQRAQLFGTCEDLFTQTFVVPYLAPMLENAGAVVWMPRERDWQTNEVVIDNDNPQVYRCTSDGFSVSPLTAAREYNESGDWTPTGMHGFANSRAVVLDKGDLPFEKGTSRMARTTHGKATASVEYTPSVPEDGDYAVYVSYRTMPKSVANAHYTVYHGGEQSEFVVNQRMGSGTWVYLGTFYFTTDKRDRNAVVIDNQSSESGVVTTDAVRFGGGMGTVSRNGVVSGMTRSNEGARYWEQYAGAPSKVYTPKKDADDYTDDYSSRPIMMNWLAGGSCYEPKAEGLHVPIELSLAVHSDAGFRSDFKSIYGTLGICTTQNGEERLGTGQPRSRSRQLVDGVVESLERDIKETFGRWTVRSTFDKNYAETRTPRVPSMILEMFSHQSLPDMKLGHDPNFKFVFSRAVYKAVTNYVADSHGQKCVFTPLTPTGFHLDMASDGRLTLSWTAQKDSLEASATAKAYKIYTALGDGAFDEGNIVKKTNVTMRLQEGLVYRFRVAAINAGGESFPSEELAAVYRKGRPIVLVANGFHRLASPQVVQGGFDLDADPGLSYGKTPVWLGHQQVFDTKKAKGEGPGTFGYTTDDIGGEYVAGNDFNYVTTHVSAIAASGLYSAVSCDARMLQKIKGLNGFAVIDLLLGNERNDGYSYVKYEALSQSFCSALMKYKGALLVSGSYVTSDAAEMQRRGEHSQYATDFLANRLNVAFERQNRDKKSTVIGLGMDFDVWRDINGTHYASTASDVLVPQGDAFVAMAYADGSCAAVGKQGQTFVMGFPFECIKDKTARNKIMKGILNFLCN